VDAVASNLTNVVKKPWSAIKAVEGLGELAELDAPPVEAPEINEQRGNVGPGMHLRRMYIR
jgi:hypothetical protein